MPLYKHESFTIDLNKIIAVYQDEDDGSVTIRTDDQRKIELRSAPETATELLNELAEQWEKAVGPLLRHGRHVYLTTAIYSIQAEGEEVYIYFRDHSVSFTLSDSQQALNLLAELTGRWEAAIQG